jgi:rod shape-determining protein MreC
VVSAGERLLTSGVGGMFPKGLPVGVVDAVLPGGEPRVRTATDLSALTYITIIQSPAVAAPEGEAE